MYKCEILADSMNPQGDRITTFRLTYPRIIHAELMTHRMFSRNSASSRAVPFEKMVKMVEEDPFIPIAWQFDHKGMQGNEYVTEESDYGGIEARNESWLQAKDFAIQQAKDLSSMDTTKQLCNRLLEPFMWHTVLVTATEYTNFYELRCPKIYHAATGLYYKSVKDWNNVDKDIQYTGLSCLHPDNQSQAEIHIQAIAEMMWDAYNESTPKKLKAGEWHIPFGDKFNIEIAADTLPKNMTTEESVIKIATARCARISYETLGDNPKIDYEADIKLHDRLLLDKHLSCFEHCARAMTPNEYHSLFKGEINVCDEDEYNIYSDTSKENPGFGWCNNFKGFINYRYLVENEKTN